MLSPCALLDLVLLLLQVMCLGSLFEWGKKLDSSSAVWLENFKTSGSNNHTKTDRHQYYSVQMHETVAFWPSPSHSKLTLTILILLIFWNVCSLTATVQFFSSIGSFLHLPGSLPNLLSLNLVISCLLLLLIRCVRELLNINRWSHTLMSRKTTLKYYVTIAMN